MSAGERPLESAAGDLRRTFDLSFAEPPRPPVAEADDYLAIEAGGEPCALPVARLAGLHGARPLTLLPGSLPELLGLATVGATVLPVYDLGALLRPSAGARSRAVRWLAVAAEAPVALAFERFDGCVRVPRADAARDGRAPDPPEQWIPHGGRQRRIVDLAAVLAGLRQRLGNSSARSDD